MRSNKFGGCCGINAAVVADVEAESAVEAFEAMEAEEVVENLLSLG